MSILIILIIIRLVPTGYYVLEIDCSFRPDDGDYMICYFNDASRCRDPYRLIPPSHDQHCNSSSAINLERWVMVASIMLVAVGMLIRLLKMYPKTSKGLAYGRRQLSIRFVNLLDKVYLWSNGDMPWSRLRQSLCYRLLLTIFLSLRLLLDFWSSMTFEVFQPSNRL